jgi:hypothetical protein
LAYKKIVHFEGKYGYKKFGKDKFEKKNEGILLLEILKKIKTTFLEHDYFPLLKLKM